MGVAELFGNGGIFHLAADWKVQCDQDLPVIIPRGWLTVHPVSRPFGTYCAWHPDPNVETLGYYQKSLRDEDLPAFLRVAGLVAKSAPRTEILDKGSKKGAKGPAF